MRRSIVLDIIDPYFSIIKSLFLSDIKDANGSCSIPIIDGRNIPVFFLASSIPDLELNWFAFFC